MNSKAEQKPKLTNSTINIEKIDMKFKRVSSGIFEENEFFTYEKKASLNQEKEKNRKIETEKKLRKIKIRFFGEWGGHDNLQ